MQFTLNISTHAGDLAIIDHDWQNARRLAAEEGFDGYELYPVGEYDWASIPEGLVTGMHLRFFPVLRPLWFGDRRRLLEIFGDEQTAKMIYGGLDRETLVSIYRRQFALAQQLGCAYTVFHLAQSEYDYIYNWRFPWSWRETIDMCAELLAAVLPDSPFTGDLLLENLWWPGSFRALDAEEIHYALERIDYPRAGVVLDTGHLMNTNQDIASEAEGIAFLVDTVRSLGDARRHIRGVHLTRSLSAEYVRRTRAEAESSLAVEEPFQERFLRAIRHVTQIDQHDPFDNPAIVSLFDVIEPSYVTYEFTYASREAWLDKIRRQRCAMAGVHGAAVSRKK
jgi:sugar phosphate isomerase/epimerase